MKVVDLFAGCGGLSLGLAKAGLDVVCALENWDEAIKVYRANFKHPVFKQDLFDVNESVNIISGFLPDIIVGGPPCQDFSSAGKRNENGGRGDLTISFAQIVAQVGPEWFVMENVEMIKRSKIFHEARKIFQNAGYGLTEEVLDASLCGVPQKRKRLFLVGKKGENNDFLSQILTSGFREKPLTVREYFGNKLDIEFYYRHPRSYNRRGIFSVDEPSPTIRGVNRPIPPDYKPHEGDASHNLTKIRPLSTIERAQIQSFPKTYKWPSSSKSTLEQLIGNAVPVNLAMYLGKAIIKYNKSLNR